MIYRSPTDIKNKSIIKYPYHIGHNKKTEILIMYRYLNGIKKSGDTNSTLVRTLAQVIGKGEIHKLDDIG